MMMTWRHFYAEDLDKISQTGAEWHVDCGDMVEVETRSRIPICRTFWGIQWHVIPELRCTLQGERIPSAMKIILNDLQYGWWNFFAVFYFFFVFLMYEGRSISKLQNGVILLIFKLWKFWNIHFAGDLILSTSCDFCYDDVTMTSFINVRYCNVAVEIIPQGTAFCYSFAVSKRT